MKLKRTANPAAVAPATWYAIGVADVVYRKHGMGPVVVTSMNDSHEERSTSLHNRGLAVDLRTRAIPDSTLGLIYDDIVKILNPQGFDVVLEANHIHIESDCKGTEQFIERTD